MDIPTIVMGYSQKYLDPYWTQNNVFCGVILFSWITYLFDLYINLRQYRVYKTTHKVPKELESVIDHETFIKSKNYSIDRAKFSLVSDFFSQTTGTLKLYFFLLPYFWDLSKTIMHMYLAYPYNQSNEIIQSIVFTFITSVLSTVIGLPFSIYSTFVIEERHGFNNQTAAFYTKDTIKKFVVNFVIMSPVVATIVYIVRSGGPNFFIYLWLFCFVVLMILTAFQGEIAAIFDKFVPLQEGELRDKIQKLADGLNFPLKQLYVVEGSARSSHSNAYFFGFFNRKRIVLYDTLIEGYTKDADTSNNKATEGDAKDEQSDEGNEKVETKDKNKKKNLGCNHDEILAILGHEMGHWQLNHLLKNIIFAEVNLFFIFMIFSFLHQDTILFSAFGFSDEKPVLIGLFLVTSYILAPYNEIQSFIHICLSRRFEFQADAFAKNLGRAISLKSGLIKLQKNNLGFPVYDSLYSSFKHSHPPLLERIEALGLVKED